MRSRSRVHLFTVAAARLENDHANPKLIADLRAAAKAEADRKVDGRDYDEAERIRIERQRTLFTMLPVSNAVDRLKASMLQRAYDLAWDGAALQADAILEFLPLKDADAVLDAWEADAIDNGKPKSKWYEVAP